MYWTKKISLDMPFFYRLADTVMKEGKPQSV